ncbi:hypothetical protein RvY_00022 [Ramazzottius varieornatus]|uniref:Guanylate kinase/L-type calcium channel beta subunit domain-containing protein n=1 Tax=Ramazzottius varieornatus TaxID=947166 RepID=A0A1D1UFG0_RAMVA|nr:hypothetical protein RvY_00022 [Ramazzottius varieornatus]
MVYLTISNEKAEERYLDKIKYVEHLPDQTEHIRRASEAFDKMTVPVIDGLKKENRVVEVDAEQGSEKVLQEAVKIYEKWLLRSKQGIDFLENYKNLAGVQSYENTRRSI